MEIIAEYILKILKTKPFVVFSWGFNSPEILKEGLRFKVNGFKFKGTVEIIYNAGSDLFDIFFYQNEQLCNSISDCYIDNLIEILDYEIELVDNYEERVKKKYLGQIL